MSNTGPRTPEATMKRHGSIAVGLAFSLGLLLLGGSGVARAGEPSSPEKKDAPYEFTGEIEAGLQIVQPRGDGKSATFDEYRDLPRTDEGGWWGHLFQVPSFRLLGEDKARTQYLEMGGTDLTRMDATYYLNAGRYNYLRFNFEYDRLPHDIANNAQTIFTEGTPGNYTIQGGAGLALALNNVANPATQPQRDAVIGAVNSLLQPTQLGFQTDTAKFGLNWLPLPELELSAGYAHTTREGSVPWGVFIGSSPTNAVELAGTRDETFHEVKAGAEYVRDWYQLRFNYTYSLFENNVDQLTWDNPCGAGAGGCRNPSGLGRYSTMPDNYANTFTGAAGVNLPWWRTRLTGMFSYAMWRQDETFLPWTTVAGFTGNTTDAGATKPDAKMNIVNGNLNLTTRPLRDVSATTRYRYYELENELPDHIFTKVLNPGDMTPSQAATNVHESEPISFRRQTVGQDITWRIIPQVMVKAAYEWDHWNRFEREVASSNENIIKGIVDVRPYSWLLGRFSYAHGVRTIHAGGYEPLGGNATALPQFRKFDEADRTQDKVDVLLQVTPTDTLTLSGSFNGWDAHFFNSAYGLQDAQSFGWSVDVQWAPIERLNLFVGYAYDQYNSQEKSCNVPGAPPTPCDPTGVNDFYVRPRDTLNTVRTGVNLAVIPKRLDLSLGYSYSLGESHQETAGVAGGVASGDPTDVPTTKNTLQIFNVVARYFVTPQWTLRLGYQYERYSETDFTTDGIAPPLAALPVTPMAQQDARSIILGAQHPPYEMHIVGLTLGYRF